MSKKTSYLMGILLAIILGTILNYYLCCNCDANVCGKERVTEVVSTTPTLKKVTKNAFVISDENGNFKIEIEDNFNFKTSEFNFLDSIPANMSDGISKLKIYLAENPLKNVEITGFYKSDEINKSAFPNLGLARANSVKNYFVAQGIPSKQIDTKGVLNDDINPDDSGTLFGPLKFGVLTQKEGDTSALDAIQKDCDSFKKNPLVLYFKTGEAQIKLSTEQQQKFAAISKCIDKLGATVQVVGHTDDTGNVEQNFLLGKERAEFAKKYLVKNGVLGNYIEALSKGQTQPIEDNTTEEGRAKNRRTVVTIN